MSANVGCWSKFLCCLWPLIGMCLFVDQDVCSRLSGEGFQSVGIGVVFDPACLCG